MVNQLVLIDQDIASIGPDGIGHPAALVPISAGLQTFVKINATLVLVDGDSGTAGCGCVVTMANTQNSYVKISGLGIGVVVEHDSGTAGPHPFVDSTSVGQNFVKILV